MPTSPYKFVGSPGYLYPFGSPKPGDVIDLTAEQAAAYGDDFEPHKPKAKTATTTKES